MSGRGRECKTDFGRLYNASESLTMQRSIAASILALALAVPLAAQDVQLPPDFDDSMPSHHDGRGLGPFHRAITTSSSEAQL